MIVPLENHPPPLNVPVVLQRYGVRPRKRLGQHFLVDESALRKVVEVSGLSGDEIALEVGAGVGGLTRWLALRGRRVVAVELDERLLPPLREVVAPFPNVEVVAGDILNLPLSRLIYPSAAEAQFGFRVVANIPYSITSALLRHLLETQPPPLSLTLTVQREVAERVCASAGEMSLLALSVQVYGAPRIMAHIPAGAFYPPPKVASAVIRVDLYTQPRLPPQDLPLFFRLARAGFSQKRKTLRNALANALGWPGDKSAWLLQKAGIDPQRRAETLDLAEWGRLTQTVRALEGENNTPKSE